MIEAICEAIFDIIYELANDKSISKWIRYPLLVIVAVVYLVLIVGCMVFGFLVMKDSPIAGIILLLLAVLLGGFVFFKARRYFAERYSE